MGIVADSLIDIGRCILGSLQPLTGNQARLRVRFSATRPGSTLMPGTFMAPVVGNALRHELLFRVRPTGPGDGGRWPADGIAEVVSNLGGERHNVVTPGTVMRLDPVLAGMAATGQVVEVLERAADPDRNAIHLRGGVLGEGTAGLTTLDLWRSRLGGHFPAVFITWDSSDPGDGLATSTLGRGRSRAGEGTTFTAETWNVFLISSREDSEAAQRGDGMRLLQEATSLLTDRQSLDGLVFSNPSGLQIRRRSKPPVGIAELAKQMQVYAITLASTNLIERADSRTYSQLLKFKVDADKHDPAGAPDAAGNERADVRVVENMRVEPTET